MSFAYPIDEHRFRETTERQAQCPGVTMPSFICIACGRRARVKGCKRLTTGRICAACHQAREYRKAVKAAKEAKQ